MQPILWRIVDKRQYNMPEIQTSYKLAENDILLTISHIPGVGIWKLKELHFVNNFQV